MYEWPKIQNLGEGPTKSLFGKDVVVEEKIDGSNISVMLDDDGIKACTRRGSVDLNKLPSSCRIGIAHLINIQHLLVHDFTYFFECRDEPDSHHTSYKCTPKNGLVLLDLINHNNREWVSSEKKRRAAKIFECDESYITTLKTPWSLHELAKFMEHDSMLGNNMEGVVVKNGIDTPVDRL